MGGLVAGAEGLGVRTGPWMDGSRSRELQGGDDGWQGSPCYLSMPTLKEHSLAGNKPLGNLHIAQRFSLVCKSGYRHQAQRYRCRQPAELLQATCINTSVEYLQAAVNMIGSGVRTAVYLRKAEICKRMCVAQAQLANGVMHRSKRS
jgi:hypothetical protein